MHRVTYFEENPFSHYARCKCGFLTKKHRTKQDVEDEVRKHEDAIERIRLHLGTSNPSMKSQRDYYREMAENPNIEPHDRRLWGILADELDKRLGRPITEDDQPTLI